MSQASHIAANQVHQEAMQSRPGECAWIYAIQAGEGGPIKIGITTGDPRVRLETLQQGNPEQLHGLAAWRDLKAMEKVLHEAYAHARIRGEWFRPVPELVEEVLYQGGVFCDWERAA